MSHKEKIRQGIIGAILVIFAFITVFPIYFLAVNSFKGQQEIVASPIALPKSWNFGYLANAAKQIDLGRSLIQTILITVLAVGLIILVSSFAAWAIARMNFKVADFLFLAYTAAILIPFQSVMYPLVSLVEKLGLKYTGAGSDVWWFWTQHVGSALQGIHKKCSRFAGGGCDA